MPLKVGLNFMGSDVRLGPRFERVLALARAADERGIDMLTFPDHLAIGRSAFSARLFAMVKSQVENFVSPRKLRMFL